MSAPKDLLTGSIEGLWQAVHEHTAGRTERVRQALGEVERALRHHAGDLAPEDDTLADPPGRPLIPSPGVERRAEELRRESRDLLRQTRALQAELSAGPGEGSDLAERVRELLRALERHERDEIDLVQQSLTTDIGAGD